jgi:hypothetical protein
MLELIPAAPLAEYAPILECLIGRTDELLSHIHTSLSLALGDSSGSSFFSASESERADQARVFREEHRARKEEIRADQASKKGGKKSKANKKHATTEEEVDGVLHPLMALKYLSYLFDHEKPRAVLLQDGVEWSTSSATSVAPGGRIVGLAEILSCFSSHLVFSLARANSRSRRRSK